MPASHRITFLSALTISVMALLAAPATALAGEADIQQFFFEDEWLDAIDPLGGGFTTLDFTGFEDGEILSDQYADEGVFFPGQQTVVLWGQSFLNDEWGIGGRGGARVVMEFDDPQNWIAADYPGTLVISLYQGDALLGDFLFPTAGQGLFAGLVSDAAFDRAELWEPDFVYADDIRFGAPIPAPSALLCLITGALLPRRSRRRSAAC